jgi:hypothetical protein
MTLTFRYADREAPKRMFLSEPSATGRYLTMCDSDWCDDVRVIDLRRRRMLQFCCSKSSANEAHGELLAPTPAARWLGAMARLARVNLRVTHA